MMICFVFLYFFIFIFIFLDGETEGGDTPSMRECASPSVQKTPTHTVSWRQAIITSFIASLFLFFILLNLINFSHVFC